MLFDKSKNIELDPEELSLQNFKLKNQTNLGRPVVGRWIESGEKVKVQGIEIVGGYFYFFEGRIDADDDGIDASTIETELGISRPPQVHQNYYSWDYALSYRFLSKRDRWTYLDWLAGDRDLDSIDAYFVWIYIFGIERRLLIDTNVELVDPDEIENLRQELSRIYREFAWPGLHALPGLLTYTWLLFASNRPPATDYEEGRFSSSFFRFRLARKVKRGEPIGVNMAWDWFQYFVGFNPKRLRNIEPLFEGIFRKRYSEGFGQGMIVEPNTTKLHIHFEPLNPALDFYRGATFDLPDISQAEDPIRKLRKLANACFSELESYQRFLRSGRKNHAGSLKAFTLLPIELLDVNAHRRAKGMLDWIRVQPKTEVEGATLIDVSLSQLLNKFGPEKFEVLGKRNLIFLSTVLERIGFSSAPNPALHISKPKKDGRIILFESTSFVASSEFKFHVLLIRLGMSVSISTDLKTAKLSEQIHQGLLTQSEKKSLMAFLFWFKKEEVNFVGLKPAVTSLELEERKRLCDLLIKIALAEKGVDKSNMKALEKIYRILGVDKAELITDIYHYGLCSSRTGTTDGRIALSNNRNDMLDLDTSLVRERENETAIVKTILAAIFVDEEDERDDAISESGLGLDAKHQAFFNALTEKDEWSENGLSKISKELNLMLNGALEVINDWAFEMTDNALIEHDGNYFIDQDTLEELTQMGGKHG